MRDQISGNERVRHLGSDAKTSFIAIGVGPANLSLAALTKPLPDIDGLFLDRRPDFQWHPGLLLPDAALQVSYLKDLVSLVDPTSAYSFLSFLHKKGRLYTFINADFDHVLRREFNEYLRWVCAEQTNIRFDQDVEHITLADSGLAVHTRTSTWHTDNLVIGIGLQPYVPACCDGILGNSVFHASCFLESRVPTYNRRVLVVGGGQTGAEVFLNLVSNDSERPASVSWISRRDNFFPLDESPFINDQFTPNYSDYFFSLPRTRRAQLINEQKLLSDGISPDTLRAIYRCLYELKHLRPTNCQWELLPGHKLGSVAKTAGGYAASTVAISTGKPKTLDVDIVILCTGYLNGIPRFLEPIRSYLEFDQNGEYQLNQDFSVKWRGPPKARIYVQNAARAQRGLADPNLSLLAWRSAKILNSIGERQIYDIQAADSIIEWSAHQASETGRSWAQPAILGAGRARVLEGRRLA